MCDRGVLLYLYICIICLGFLCNFLATILPFWFAEYPISSAGFQSLGLWEICFERFISPLNQQCVFSGCFYIFDTKLRTLWPLIFTGWFHAAQSIQIISMIFYAALVGCGLAILFEAVDKRRSRTVVLSISLMAFICWAIITQLGVVGVNFDLEKKHAKSRGTGSWMVEIKFPGLSWSYGLAAFALFFILVALNILVWCVYPRKELGGRLLEQAWFWPATDDLPCCMARSTSYREMGLQNNQRYDDQSSCFQRCQPNPPSFMELETYHSSVNSHTVATYDPRFISLSNNASVLLGGSKDDLYGSIKEMEQTEGRSSSQLLDPRTAADPITSSGLGRTQNRTYVIKKGVHPSGPPSTIIPKPLVPREFHG